MRPRYVIVSRARAETVSVKTIATLHRLGVEDREISVYVHPDEFDDYASAFTRHGIHPNLMGGVHGMAAQRVNALLCETEGQPTISCDDDMSDVLIRRNEKLLEPITPGEWGDVVEEGFDALANGLAVCWGLYPVRNPFFMKPRLRLGEATYLPGCCFGYLSTRDPESPLRVTMSEKEDYERSVRCYLAGGVARFDYVTFAMKYRGEPGGIEAEHDRSSGVKERESLELARRYPGIVHLKRRKSGEVELTLADRRVRA